MEAEAPGQCELVEGSEWPADWSASLDCRFLVHGEPQPQGSMRSVPTGWHASSRTGRRERTHRLTDVNVDLKPWRANIVHEAVKVWGGKAPLNGEVLVALWFGFLRPANQRQRDGALRGNAPDLKPTSPDVDKLGRAVLDALEEAGVLQNDARVVALLALKGYSTTPRLVVGIRQRAPRRPRVDSGTGSGTLGRSRASLASTSF